MDLELAGRTALVSGSWRGTGAGIAAALAAEGAHVLVHALEAGAADPVVARLRAAGGRADAVAGDIVADEGAAALADAALALGGGRVDILVNNYGKSAPGHWPDLDSSAWIEMYQVNVLSAARLVRLLVEPMKRAGWGRIVQLGTLGATRPNARSPHYYAAKAALANMTVGLAKELAGTGVTSNLISPGLIATAEVVEQYGRLAREKGWGDSWAEVEARIATELMPNANRRVPSVQQVADVVCFVCSPRAAAINGANLRVDGGALDVVT